MPDWGACSWCEFQSQSRTRVDARLFGDRVVLGLCPRCFVTLQKPEREWPGIPTECGHYWVFREGERPDIVHLHFSMNWEDPMVEAHGRTYAAYTDARYYGPLRPPWILPTGLG